MNGCRVLIVDDRSQAREELKALLATAPAVQVVGEASSGKEATELVEKCRPHVVLMDAMMPVMNGLEATRRIKAEWPDIRVIVLTIHTALRAEALAIHLAFRDGDKPVEIRPADDADTLGVVMPMRL